MSTVHTWQTIFEIGMAIFLIWGVCHEDKFIRFEKRIKKFFINNK
jgi:hypothetical protein